MSVRAIRFTICPDPEQLSNKLTAAYTSAVLRQLPHQAVGPMAVFRDTRTVHRGAHFYGRHNVCSQGQESPSSSENFSGCPLTQKTAGGLG